MINQFAHLNILLTVNGAEKYPKTVHVVQLEILELLQIFDACVFLA
jgi:hypothetical protein